MLRPLKKIVVFIGSIDDALPGTHSVDNFWLVNFSCRNSYPAFQIAKNNFACAMTRHVLL